MATVLAKIGLDRGTDLTDLFNTVRQQIQLEQHFSVLFAESTPGSKATLDSYCNLQRMTDESTGRHALQSLLQKHFKSDAGKYSVREQVILVCQMAKFYHWCEEKVIKKKLYRKKKLSRRSYTVCLFKKL